MSDGHEQRIEQRIEAALDALRETRAPEGMESRVLAALRMREAAAGTAQHAGPAGGGRGLVWVGVAAAVVLSVGLLAVSRREAPAAGERVANGVAHRGPVVRSDTRAVTEAKDVAKPAAKWTAHVKQVRQARNDVPVTQEAARSSADLPSFPAAPAPLTEEERLLLRVVRTGDRVELAMLDPAMRNERVEEEKAEVRKFFGEVTDTAPDKGDSR